jgi:anti-sigma regulatory factor (Ser/Thr protein kinase)
VGLSFTVDLPPDTSAAGRARELVADRMASAPAERRATALLLVSELVTNAVQHGAGLVVLTVISTPSVLRVNVFDEGERRPQARMASPDEPWGRGLLLVDRLALAWGVEDGAVLGKTVWFELGLGDT